MGAFGRAGGGYARRTVAWSTASLANNASENDDVTLNRAAACYRVSTSRAARVRAYATAAQRTADAARLVGVAPSGDHGVLMDVVTTPSLLGVSMAPVPELVNLDGSPSSAIYFAVTNLDVVGVVTTTLIVRQAE